MIMISMFMTILITILILLLNILPIINMHKITDREKTTPFECGFDPLSKYRVSFSIHFFLVGIMFLIFDIEITLILPIPLSFYLSNFYFWILTIIFIMVTLIMGTMIEWKEGSMNWK
uniref:NADH-ubiquinone oxidoreductase chain 3 n=1 Tax=Mycopsylla proxima TaxID=1681221 RepID=A0A343UQT6_9HEMI|nr:NADH dehydrogenase subunit 3 [Mycopsylla proxima]AVF97061.1 NADH dehydrogenase subunit 3 [Mycopsylla proxima]